MGTGVRNHGHKIHAGWDLYAQPGTSAFAIADGTVVQTGTMDGYGKILLLEFAFDEETLYALYAHLRSARFHPGKNAHVTEGTSIAFTGTSGNAGGEPPHLHFEIWNKRHVGRFPDGRLNPGEVLGYLYENLDNFLPFRDRA